MKDISKIIGNNIKEIRKRTNITQTELASLINVDPKYISRLETGTSTPSLNVIAKLSNALRAELKEFFFIDTKDKRENIINLINNKLTKANLKELNAILEVTSCMVD